MGKVILKKNYHLSKDGCTENNFNLGTYFNNIISIIKKNVSTILFNRQQFSVTNFAVKPNTTYVELNPDFIETLTPKIITGSTDSPLADNGIQVITSNVKNILVYDQQLEFVNSIVESNTSTLKLRDTFVQALFNNQNNKVKQFTIYNQQPFSNNITQDLVNYMNVNTSLSLDQFEIGVIDFYDDNLNKVQFLFGPGKGDYGVGFTTADLGMLYQISSSSEQDTLQTVTNSGNITTNDIIVTGPQGQAVLRHFNGFGPGLLLGNNFRIDYTAFNDRNRINTVSKWLEFIGNDVTRMMLKPTGELGINVFNPTAILHTNGNIKHENLTNAQGDSTFTKQVVAKVDGTFGIEDKVLNRQVFYVTGTINQTDSNAPIVTISLQDVNDIALTFTTQYISTGWYVISLASTLVNLSNYKIEAFIQDKAFGPLSVAITDDTKFEFQGSTMVLLSLRNGALTDGITANQFSIHLYRR